MKITRIDPDAPVRDGGHIALPDGPGLGVEPDIDLLGVPEMVIE